MFSLVLSSLAAQSLRGKNNNVVDTYLWPIKTADANAELDSIQARAMAGKLETHSHDNTASAAGRRRLGAQKTGGIHGCFIVSMAANVTDPHALIAELARTDADASFASLKSDVSRRISSGFAACMSPSTLEMVLASPDVAYVEQDVGVQVKQPLWGLDRIDNNHSTALDGVFATGTLDGAGVDVYFLDTGINTQHHEFKGRVRGGRNFVKDEDGRGYEDCMGHGSVTAGMAVGSTYGVAKRAHMYAVRVLGCDGAGAISGVIEGIDWAVKNANATGRPSVLFMGLGGGSHSTNLNGAVAAAKRKGLTVVVPAGNSNRDACTTSPASALQSVITVGASTPTDERASFSNYGACVDIYAPGTGVKSVDLEQGTKTMSGTSMAAAYVAGAAALELQLMAAEGKLASPDAVWLRLQQRAVKGKIASVKWGSNLLLQAPWSDVQMPMPAHAEGEEDEVGTRAMTLL
jgi:subtilisin family serine protease